MKPKFSTGYLTPQSSRRKSLPSDNGVPNIKISDDVFHKLMQCPVKRKQIIDLITSEKHKIEAYKKKLEEQNTLRSSPLQKVLKKPCESPTALLRRRALQQRHRSESNSDSESLTSNRPGSRQSSVSTVPSPVSFDRILNGVVAFVEVTSGGRDRSAGVKATILSMGAKVRDKFTKDVTHVIFKNGTYITYKKADLMKAKVVSVLWVEACKSNGIKVLEKDYPAIGTTAYDHNVSALCSQMQRDYEDVLKEEKEEHRRSIATDSPLPSTKSLAQRRRTIMTPNVSGISFLLTQSQTQSLDAEVAQITRSRNKSSDSADDVFVSEMQFDEISDTGAVIDGDADNNACSVENRTRNILLQDYTPVSASKERASCTTNVMEDMDLTELHGKLSSKENACPNISGLIYDQKTPKINSRINPTTSYSKSPNELEGNIYKRRTKLFVGSKVTSADSNQAPDISTPPNIKILSKNNTPKRTDDSAQTTDTTNHTTSTATVMSALHLSDKSVEESTSTAISSAKLSNNFNKSVNKSNRSSRGGISTNNSFSPLQSGVIDSILQALASNEPSPADHIILNKTLRSRSVANQEVLIAESPTPTTYKKSKENVTIRKKKVAEFNKYIDNDLENLLDDELSSKSNKSVKLAPNSAPKDFKQTVLSFLENSEDNLSEDKDLSTKSNNSCKTVRNNAPKGPRQKVSIVLVNSEDNLSEDKDVSTNLSDSGKTLRKNAPNGPRQKVSSVLEKSEDNLSEDKDVSTKPSDSDKTLRKNAPKGLRQTVPNFLENSEDILSEDKDVFTKPNDSGKTAPKGLRQKVLSFLDSSECNMPEEIEESEEQKNGKARPTTRLRNKRKTLHSFPKAKDGSNIKSDENMDSDLTNAKSRRKTISSVVCNTKKSRNPDSNGAKSSNRTVRGKAPHKTADTEETNSDETISNSTNVCIDKTDDVATGLQLNNKEASPLKKLKLSPPQERLTRSRTKLSPTTNSSKDLKSPKKPVNESKRRNTIGSSSSRNSECTKDNRENPSEENDSNKKRRLRKLYDPHNFMTEAISDEKERNDNRQKARQSVGSGFFIKPTLIFPSKVHGEAVKKNDKDLEIDLNLKLNESEKKIKKSKKDVQKIYNSDDDEQVELKNTLLNRKENVEEPNDKPSSSRRSLFKSLKSPIESKNGTDKDTTKPATRKKRSSPSPRKLTSKRTQQRVLRTPITPRNTNSSKPNVRLTPITPLRNRRSTMEFQIVPMTTPRRLKIDKTKTPCIVCTKMHKPDVQIFTQIVKKLGHFNVEDEVSTKTTHLVAGEPKRTINMLRAITMGCWILKKEWLFMSLEAGKWLPEEDFEETGFSPAVQKNRLQRQAFGPSFTMDIFQDCGPMYITRGSIPRCSDLQELVLLCKGYVTKIARNATIAVGEYIKYDGVISVSENWILDCISSNKRLSFKKYLIKLN